MTDAYSETTTDAACGLRPEASPVAKVLPFPLVRRRDFVRRHAARMAAFGASGAETYLAQQLSVQRAVMERRGIAAADIDRQISAVRGEIRAALWRIVLTPGGAA